MIDTPPTAVEVLGVSKTYPNGTQALQPVDLTVQQGEFVALLGPSGCGKTTLLRIIAGMETADQGDILFSGAEATHLHARERNVGFVFQHYALFGHMTIFENVAFGLRVRPKATRPAEAVIRAKVKQLLELVQLDFLADRFPHQLGILGDDPVAELERLLRFGDEVHVGGGRVAGIELDRPQVLAGDERAVDDMGQGNGFEDLETRFGIGRLDGEVRRLTI